MMPTEFHPHFFNGQAAAYANCLRCKTAMRKAVLIQIAACCNHLDLACFPSQKTLAERVGIEVRQLRTHLQGLEEEGKIRRIKRREQDGRVTTDNYIVVGLREYLNGHNDLAQQALADANRHENDVNGSDTSGRNLPVSSGRNLPTNSKVLIDKPNMSRNLATGGRNASGDNNELELEQFENFWSRYPKRLGRRERKMQALEQWGRMSREDRDLAAEHVSAWAEGRRKPCDAVEYLRHSRWMDLDDVGEASSMRQGGKHVLEKLKSDAIMNNSDKLLLLRAKLFERYGNDGIYKCWFDDENASNGKTPIADGEKLLVSNAFKRREILKRYGKIIKSCGFTDVIVVSEK